MNDIYPGHGARIEEWVEPVIAYTITVNLPNQNGPITHHIVGLRDYPVLQKVICESTHHRIMCGCGEPNMEFTYDQIVKTTGLPENFPKKGVMS